MPPPLPTASVICSECHKPFAPGDVVMIQNAAVCAGCKPIVVQRLKEGVTAIQSGIWRDDKLLVTTRQATLPDRCIKCNAPTNGFRLTRKLSWHPPGWYFLIMLNLIIYAIVASMVSKKATVAVGLCPEHRQKRRNGLFVAWGLFVGSIICFTLAAVFDSGWLVLPAFLLLLASPIYGIVRCRVVAAKRIDENNAFIQGACPEFLDTLPRWS